MTAMPDQEPHPRDPVSELASFGEELRREREIRGISLKEIADATKISRRFGVALFGPSKALETRNFPPGQHGARNTRRKQSEYGIALAEKQNHPERFALIVAVNKMDVKGANLDQVKNQMQQRNIAPEDWGGETITVPVSAIKGQGITELLEMILLQADVLELKSNPKADASGVVRSELSVRLI